MALRITCPLCYASYGLAEEARGKTIICRKCQNSITIPATAPPPVDDDRDWITDRPVRLPPPVRRDRPPEDDGPDLGRPGRGRSGLAPVLLLAGGGVTLVAVLVVVACVFLLPGSRSAAPSAAEAAPEGAKKPVEVALKDAPDVKPAAPEAGPPDPGPVQAGEKVYQDLLHSTVWIVAPQKNAAPPLAGNPVGGPVLPGPGMGLAGTQWAGRETLPGYGPLRFEFQAAGQVVMVDKDGRTPGNYVQNGAQVTLTFDGGGVTYTGQVNGNLMSGTARNLRVNWTWSLTRQGAGGLPGLPTVRPPLGPRLGPRLPGLPGVPRFPLPPAGLPNFPGPGAQPGVAAGPPPVSAGTGSLIDAKERLVVTNCHVVGDSERLVVYFPERENGRLVVKRDDYKRRPGIPGRVVLREPRIDLALVQLERLPAGVKALPLSREGARPAQQVHSVGNPGASGALWVYSPGKVRQVFADRWNVFDDLDRKEHVYDGMKIETDSPINPGDSGGPLVNDRGRLLGVAHASNVGAQNMSIFIDVSEVRGLITRYYQARGRKWEP